MIRTEDRDDTDDFQAFFVYPCDKLLSEIYPNFALQVCFFQSFEVSLEVGVLFSAVFTCHFLRGEQWRICEKVSSSMLLSFNRFHFLKMSE